MLKRSTAQVANRSMQGHNGSNINDVAQLVFQLENVVYGVTSTYIA